MQALLLPLHADWYALELLSVREVLPMPEIAPLPGSPPHLLGLFNLRGEVVPLFDTARLLGLGPGPAGDQLVVAESVGAPAGLIAHGRPWREELGAPAGPGELAAALGRYTVRGGVATLLDVTHLLAEAAA